MNSMRVSLVRKCKSTANWFAVHTFSNELCDYVLDILLSDQFHNEKPLTYIVIVQMKRINSYMRSNW